MPSMTPLRPGQPIVRLTGCLLSPALHSGGRHRRQLVVTLHPQYLELHLLGTRTTRHILPYDAAYALAARLEAVHKRVDLRAAQIARCKKEKP